MPTPVVSRDNESNPTSTVDAIKSENTTDPKVTNTNNSSNLIPKGDNNNNNSNNTITGSVDANPPTDKQLQKEKNHEVNEEGKQMEKEKNHVVNEKGDHTSFSELVTSESCEGVWRRCRIQDTMLACIQTSEHGNYPRLFVCLSLRNIINFFQSTFAFQLWFVSVITINLCTQRVIN